MRRRNDFQRELQQPAGVDNLLVHPGVVVGLVGRAKAPTVRRHQLVAAVAEREFGRPVDTHEGQSFRILDVHHRRNVLEDAR